MLSAWMKETRRQRSEKKKISLSEKVGEGSHRQDDEACSTDQNEGTTVPPETCGEAELILKAKMATSGSVSES
ncbi:unnamed protein product [Arabis nemorensis]|uniref:Uncharacterized protein n=1 Tax=Arabis nemorensis TaxID=586526 RepID=A0A565CPK3_9BRAS|nr:unnamed protein product [Arabis nemorensis]